MELEEQKFMDSMQQELQDERMRRLSMQNDYSRSSGFDSEKQNNLAELQLDLDKELDRMHHLLSGHHREIKDGIYDWVEPKDDREKIFSVYGVNRINNILCAYLNINTLLSNYDNITITWKMKDFGIELNDLIYCQIESFLFYPSPEELFEKYYIPSPKLSELEFYHQCVQWSKEEFDRKKKNVDITHQMIMNVVHSTYLRALNGEERDSLRKQMHISQSNNTGFGGMQQGKSFSLVKPSTW